ncbi:MAG: sulfotransferase [Desulfobacteraceae bacterium]|jgi:hypothetical protein|nr:sulfotransferase [Desulfobacteraceae bacterium]
MQPFFFVIGAMKCGTTSLHHYLSAHPEICVPQIKETDFFLENKFHKGLDWYKKLFSQPGLKCGEVAPNYSKRHIFPGVAERMADCAPGARLIYLMRDPVDRIRSHFLHNIAAGREKKTTFSQAIRKTHNNYVYTSSYYYQLKPFRTLFGDDKILLLTAESLKLKRAETLRTVFQFLEVDDRFWHSDFAEHYNTCDEKRGSLVDSNTVLSDRLWIKEDDYDYLRKYFESEMMQLREWSGMRFHEWSM